MLYYDKYKKGGYEENVDSKENIAILDCMAGGGLSENMKSE